MDYAHHSTEMPSQGCQGRFTSLKSAGALSSRRKEHPQIPRKLGTLLLSIPGMPILPPLRVLCCPLDKEVADFLHLIQLRKGAGRRGEKGMSLGKSAPQPRIS